MSFLFQNNTFQVVLVTDGRKSFVFFIYGDIQWGTGAQIGFNAGDGGRSFMVPGALTNSTVDIETMSNVGRKGMFAFRVDGSEVEQPTGSIH